MNNEMINIGDVVTIISCGKLIHGIVCNINDDGDCRVSDNIDIRKMAWSVWIDYGSMIKGELEQLGLNDQINILKIQRKDL